MADRRGLAATSASTRADSCGSSSPSSQAKNISSLTISFAHHLEKGGASPHQPARNGTDRKIQYLRTFAIAEPFDQYQCEYLALLLRQLLHRGHRSGELDRSLYSVARILADALRFLHGSVQVFPAP